MSGARRGRGKTTRLRAARSLGLGPGEKSGLRTARQALRRAGRYSRGGGCAIGISHPWPAVPCPTHEWVGHQLPVVPVRGGRGRTPTVASRLAASWARWIAGLVAVVASGPSPARTRASLLREPRRCEGGAAGREAGRRGVPLAINRDRRENRGRRRPAWYRVGVAAGASPAAVGP